MTAVAESGDRWSESDLVARARLVAAAIDCVAERGYIGTTFDHVSRAAGLDRALAERYFGTREGLLLAAFQHGVETLRAHVEDSQIEGVTVEERLDSFASIIADFYGDRRYLATLQIQLNLMHDPALSEQAVSSLALVAQVTGPAIFEMISTVFEGAVRPTEEYVSLLFFALRGLALSHVVNDALPGPAAAVQKPHDWAQQRRLLVRGLGAVYRDLAVGKLSSSRPDDQGR
jgi:AcrR family transcriptional regulator